MGARRGARGEHLRRRDDLGDRRPVAGGRAVRQCRGVHGAGAEAVRARFAPESPFRPVRIRGIHADGDTVVVLWDGEGGTTAGTTYRNTYAWIMTLRDGEVIEGTAFYDSIAFDELWDGVALDGAAAS